ncbi:hypothetical protein MKZ38_003113 [Zalerion maritima]|uniref:Dopey N-terminal domain-containing protein n=1 Tax=Zalerion maritima TaxID=339359 RepID=A0AAD5WWN9_9PEZI|nr:hypothetical protein MKZ38_003113 [Zalerion maritima]
MILSNLAAHRRDLGNHVSRTGPPIRLPRELRQGFSAASTVPKSVRWRTAPANGHILLLLDDAPKDKHFRKYASGVERALALFDTALQEWADYISFLNRLLKALQARPSNQKVIPAKSIVSKRLAQCLNPSLPSGVHQKTLEVYNYVFSVIGNDGLSRDLPLYLPGLAPTLSFASLSVRAPFLGILERYFLDLDPRTLRPAMKSIILALLPGLEDETSEDFDRTLRLVERFKRAIRPMGAEEITEMHATGDDFFWQCFFLASITGQGRRPGALTYLVRNVPKLGHQIVHDSHGIKDARDDPSQIPGKLTELVTFPEPGLLLRCFAAALGDEQLLIQRGFLDLLVTHLPLHCKVLQERVKSSDLELLLKAAVGVVTRRDMSLNRRLWTWLIGPEPALGHENTLDCPVSEQHFTHKTSYFEEFGLHPLTQALLGLIDSNANASPAERARPYRICLSLMDKWEVGGLVVPEVFLPVVDSVRSYKKIAPSKADFSEVLRSASVFFDGVESGLIYGVMVGLVVQALGPGKLTGDERADKLDLVEFMVSYFNVREEEMVTIHAPLTALAILCILDDSEEGSNTYGVSNPTKPRERALRLATKFMDMVPERTFPPTGKSTDNDSPDKAAKEMPNAEHLKKIKEFYMHNQGNLDAAEPPFNSRIVGELLLRKTTSLVCESLSETDPDIDIGIRSRFLMLALMRAKKYWVNSSALLKAIHSCLSQPYRLAFTSFSSIIALVNNLYSTDRITPAQLSELVTPLVQHAWSFLASGEPKYHVETVRGLWQLQTALTPFNRDIEASISALIIKDCIPGTYAIRPADGGRSFCVLWTHTLQDQAHGHDRRTPKTPHHDLRNFPRLAGVDNFDVMLTRPLFLMLDSLLDERTQLFMTVKAWLHNMVGVDRLFEVFVTKLSELHFLQTISGTGETASFAQAVDFSVDDDLDMCLYYLRTLSNIFRWAPDMFWYVLASAHVTIDDNQMHLRRITGSEVDISFQEFFLQVCMRCMAGNNTPSDERLKLRIAQLQRCALTVLHQILLNPYGDRFSGLNLETILIDRLTRSLNGPDPYIQVLLLDVVHGSLRIRDATPTELPATSPTLEKKMMNFDRRGSKQSSIAIETGPKLSPPPQTLLKCIQAGFTSSSSRTVLDSWVRFLTECLPFYRDSIFQVLIPLVETLCAQIENCFKELQALFRDPENALGTTGNSPESTLIFLLNGLEHILAEGHKQLLAEEARTQSMKSPEQPQSFFGSVVSGVFTSEAQQSRSATANDRLTVLLAFQDAVRMCFTIWSWGQGPQENMQDTSSAASFNYTSLRMRNRARRLLEHLFEAETMECLETVVEIWKASLGGPDNSNSDQVLKLLPALDGSRPKHTMPAVFNAIYSRTNPGALDPSRKSTFTIELNDTELVIFLVDYARSLEDDAMDEIWQDCLVFLKDLLANPFPHRQILPSLIEFTAILGEKVDNTKFGDDRKLRRELGDLFMRLLTALFTTRPMTFDSTTTGGMLSPRLGGENPLNGPSSQLPSSRAEDVVGILGSIVPILPTVLLEPDRVLAAASTISTNVIGPCFKSRAFPDSVSKSCLSLLRELAKLPNNQKAWKKDVSDAFNDGRFFGSALDLVKSDWLEILRQWTVADKEKVVTELLGRITAPSTAGIVFGVGATSARQEADRRTQLNLRRIAALVLAGPKDGFVTELPGVVEKIVELLGATATSSPSSATRADVYMLLRAMVLKIDAVHLTGLWPVVNAELHAAVSSVVAADHSTPNETFGNGAVLQACKLLDLLVCTVPDDWQLSEWLFVTDTIDSVYRPAGQEADSVVALVDELSEVLGASGTGGQGSALQGESAASLAAKGKARRPLIGVPGGVGEELLSSASQPGGGSSAAVWLERREELVARVLRPFFGQLSIYSFESTYAMVPVDVAGCEEMVLRDLFDERGVVRAV